MSTTNNTPSPATCMDDFDPNSLTLDKAWQRIEQNISVLNKPETVAIREALNRVLAQEVASPIDVPSYTNSAMDGYAIRAADLATNNDKRFTVAATIMAGAPVDRELHTNECMRIMTGAKMPREADTVVMQEHVTRHDDTIVIERDIQPGQNVRQAGEDIRRGDTVLQRGRRLTPADIGLLASLGIAQVGVYCPVRVAFFSTGDELVSLGEQLKEGQIYDSNRYTLFAMLQRFGADIVDMGVIRDNPDSIEKAFRTAAQQADMLITTGGVSVGDADYVKDTLAKLGEVDFWKIAMKPGRPLAFGTLQEKSCVFFGLPGNPVSTMVTYYLLVLPALRKMQGETAVSPSTLQATCTTPLRKLAGRVEYQRGFMEHNRNGELTVRAVGGQGSHILSSMSKSNCFIVLPLECGDVDANTTVTVLPFAGLI